MHKEYLYGNVEGANDEELEDLISKLVNHKNDHSELSIAWMFRVIANAYHLQIVVDNSPRGLQSACLLSVNVLIDKYLAWFVAVSCVDAVGSTRCV